MVKFGAFLICAVLLGAAPTQSTAVFRGGRIIGGEIARAGQFPFAAAIYKNTADGTYFCTGTIIMDDFILTSGQCVDGAILFSILIGTNNLNANEGTRLSTDTYFQHPGYNPETLENDLGIIKTRLPITFTDYIQPVNFLADFRLPDGSSVFTLGWGQTSDEESGLVNALNYVVVVSLTLEDCMLTYGSQVTDNMVCVEGNYNQGTCRGDLGSPLIQYGSRGVTYLVGVSSFISSNGCESTDPSGFTRISPYRDWIRNITSNN
ncbi:hypothetical protein Zmor_015448 [Zophobas morio]|uniref:Peptidase S1 domain-containing protein n=1 Tax=Zophobas morio TaxID=2755281 RepID=A0AA38II05_9CUCU|nr:hypothetical protein Zmor_015448 [Zophobas morio]